MEGDHIKICYWLKPLSWLYGLVINLRNILFDSGMLPSESFDVPVICVGNITAGGTGKTPHTEYLIRLLSKQHQGGKTRDQVRKLIAGPGVYICDDCVQVCDDILKDIEDEEGDFDTNLKLPKPKEIKAFLDEYVARCEPHGEQQAYSHFFSK